MLRREEDCEQKKLDLSAMAAMPPARPKGRRAPLKIPREVEMVGSSESTVWCCIAPTAALKTKVSKKSSSWSELQSASKENGLDPDGATLAFASTDSVGRRLEQKTKPRRKHSAEKMRKAGETLKNGEIAALLKQGFISTCAPPSTESSNHRGNMSPFKIRLSPGRVSPLTDAVSVPSPSPDDSTAPAHGFKKLNSLLNTAGFLSSSPSPAGVSSPTLVEVMAREQEKQIALISNGSRDSKNNRISATCSPSVRKTSSSSSPTVRFDHPASSDVKLTLTCSTGSLTVNLHDKILTSHSRFFAAKLSERWSRSPPQLPHIIQISDCEDVESYLEALRLMYCKDMRKKLLKKNVLRVLGILKVCAAIVFEEGIVACLEYLEAVPWTEEEERKVRAVLSQLQLESIGAGEVLQRLSGGDLRSGGSQEVLVRFLHLVTKGTDEKARRELKDLVSRLLRENSKSKSNSNPAAQCEEAWDLSEENVYQACSECLESLLHLFLQASNPAKVSEDRSSLMGQITRQADNLCWLVGILIDRQMADEFVRIWAYQVDLARLHGQVPIAMGRYEVSRLTARLCVAIGKGEVVVPKETRFALLNNWLQPLIDDFGWMQRACRGGLDRNAVEDGISQAILTLSLRQQQTIMMAWFDRFLRTGDDCPNLHRAFEIWWRRTFLRPHV